MEEQNLHGVTETFLTPEAEVMHMVMGAWVSQAISTVTRLDIPDLLQAHGPLTALQLTKDYGVQAQPGALERVLRAAASVGLFTEDAQGRFGLTPLSDVLTTTSSVSLKKLIEIFGASWWQLWGGLEATVRTGTSQTQAQFGMDYRDYCKTNPHEMVAFGEAMHANSRRTIHSLLDTCDLTGAKRFVDIGGSFGHLAIALLQQYKALYGVVLELPEVVALAKQRLAHKDTDLLSRLEFMGGDMFQEVPVADVYIMKHVIHNWDDTACLRLLQNCYTSMEGDGRVLCVDAVLPPVGETSGTSGKLLDVDMLVFGFGKERTAPQWHALFERAGFTITSITPLHDNFGTSLVEGIKNDVKASVR